jgi:hypothetical protein
MLSRAIRLAATLLLTASFSAAVVAADAPSEKWLLVFQGRATSDGEMQLRLTPQTGEAILLTVKINSGRGEMYMARDVHAALKKQLPMPRFKTEILHGQEVLVKAGRGEPVFALELVQSSVTGTKVHLGPT